MGYNWVFWGLRGAAKGRNFGIPQAPKIGTSTIKRSSETKVRRILETLSQSMLRQQLAIDWGVSHFRSNKKNEKATDNRVPLLAVSPCGFDFGWCRHHPPSSLSRMALHIDKAMTPVRSSAPVFARNMVVVGLLKRYRKALRTAKRKKQLEKWSNGLCLLRAGGSFSTQEPMYIWISTDFWPLLLTPGTHTSELNLGRAGEAWSATSVSGEFQRGA